MLTFKYTCKFYPTVKSISILDILTFEQFITFLTQGYLKYLSQFQAVRARSDTMKYFPSLRDWISRFLDENKDMTASLIGHNMLVEQVLRLVHYLVKFGYYGDIEDIKRLLIPLLSLLDGRNDKPYPNKPGRSLCTSKFYMSCINTISSL